jgi:hypothetical protein
MTGVFRAIAFLVVLSVVACAGSKELSRSTARAMVADKLANDSLIVMSMRGDVFVQQLIDAGYVTRGSEQRCQFAECQPLGLTTKGTSIFASATGYWNATNKYNVESHVEVRLLTALRPTSVQITGISTAEALGAARVEYTFAYDSPKWLVALASLPDAQTRVLGYSGSGSFEIPIGVPGSRSGSLTARKYDDGWRRD